MPRYPPVPGALSDTAVRPAQTPRRADWTLGNTGVYRVVTNVPLQNAVYLAELQKKIPPTALRQQGLDKLAQLHEFTGVLHKEVQARNLDVKDVMACFDHFYKKVSNRTNGNDDTFNDSIIVRATKFTDNERAALVTLLKIQSNWPHPLKWREDTLCKGGG